MNPMLKYLKKLCSDLRAWLLPPLLKPRCAVVIDGHKGGGESEYWPATGSITCVCHGYREVEGDTLRDVIGKLEIITGLEIEDNVDIERERDGSSWFYAVEFVKPENCVEWNLKK